MSLAKSIRKFLMLGQTKRSSPERVEHLRADFKSRYHSFKLLLIANRRALEIITDLETALAGEKPFGMGYVRAQCTRLATSVFQMINHLNEITDGKYNTNLKKRFRSIQENIHYHLASPARSLSGPLVVQLADVNRSSLHQTGSKMSTLGEIKNRLGLAVPEGFVVTATAYELFMTHQDLRTRIDELIVSTERETVEQLHDLSEALEDLITNASLPWELEGAITEQYRLLEQRLGRGLPVVLRSSALNEDEAGRTFAGQYRTFFNVTGNDLIRTYKKVVASKYRFQAIMYRLNHGIRDDDLAMCVGVMPVVQGRAGGIVYSRNPLDKDDDTVLIHSVWGLPKPIVDGVTASDRFVVSRGDPLQLMQKEIATKRQRFAYDPAARECRMEPIPELSQESSISDGLVIEIARIALSLEELFGVPQDVEWAVQQDGSIALLQSRPLQQLDSRRGEPPSANLNVDEESVALKGGTTASPGAASGPVFMVRKRSDAVRLPEGSILVAAQSLPYWATVMDRAAAVITEQGGVVGHLANVAREFKVPALFGVEGAMRRFEPGEVVTVNADTHTIYKGIVEAIVTKRSDMPRNQIQGGRVYRSLNGAAKHIIPLHLLDPTSSRFRARNCLTFHDITRFCHEKAVVGMFQFGVEHSFPERSSKQLHCDVPMQFWIIDLDDGFSETMVDTEYVRLEQITSIPMLALWRGMMAITWAGPPPMDARGFLSVLRESTNDPALLPSMPSAYAVRNYFMISRNYCSLQSRFGYHFSTVEALVGERVMENYITFQFKGGAANLGRRIRRARLIAEVLEENEFSCSLAEDSVRARVEGYDQRYMEMKLQILGYLTIHTRQLDMVATSEHSMRQYRNKIRQDLAQVSSLRQ